MDNNTDPRGEETPASPNSRDGGAPKPCSTDAGWREALSGLGVDVEAEERWNEAARGPEPKAPAAGREGEAEPMEARSHWVGESEVSIERLYELFDGAYMECDLDEDGDLRVVTDSGPRIFLSLHEPNKLVRYMAFYKFRDEATEYDKLLFVNALNDDIVFIRFSLNGADTLIADYYLPYARGASPFHIVNAAKLMGRVITSGIRQHDQNNLLE